MPELRPGARQRDPTTEADAWNRGWALPYKYALRRRLDIHCLISRSRGFRGQIRTIYGAPTQADSRLSSPPFVQSASPAYTPLTSPDSRLYIPLGVGSPQHTPRFYIHPRPVRTRGVHAFPIPCPAQRFCLRRIDSCWPWPHGSSGPTPHSGRGPPPSPSEPLLRRAPLGQPESKVPFRRGLAGTSSVLGQPCHPSALHLSHGNHGSPSANPRAHVRKPGLPNANWGNEWRITDTCRPTWDQMSWSSGSSTPKWGNGRQSSNTV